MNGKQIYSVWREFKNEPLPISLDELIQIDIYEVEFNNWLKNQYGFYFERNNKLHVINTNKKLLFDIKYPK